MVTTTKKRKSAIQAKPQKIPIMPPADRDGCYPAAETLQVIIAQQIIERRKRAGWSQADLAQRARVRQETICRLETGKHAPTVRTIDKIDRALAKAGA